MLLSKSTISLRYYWWQKIVSDVCYDINPAFLEDRETFSGKEGCWKAVSNAIASFSSAVYPKYFQLAYKNIFDLYPHDLAYLNSWT